MRRSRCKVTGHLKAEARMGLKTDNLSLKQICTDKFWCSLVLDVLKL